METQKLAEHLKGKTEAGQSLKEFVELLRIQYDHWVRQRASAPPRPIADFDSFDKENAIS